MVLNLHGMAKRLRTQSIIFTERQRSLFGSLRKGLLEKDSPWGASKSPDLLIYHHSIGSIAAERFLAWPAKQKILVFHNITPADLLDSLSAKSASQRGMEQLSDLVRLSDVQVGLSQFSCATLSEYGAKSIVTLPYLMASIRQTPSQAKRPTILVVGRIEPFKGVLECVQAVEYLIRETLPTAQLSIVGSLKANPTYAEELKAYITSRGLEKKVKLHGKISAMRLRHLYQRSKCLLSLSKHEGFCVPIAEAMYYGVPAVALARGATSETLGKGGILVNSQDSYEVAAALYPLLCDEALRKQIQDTQRTELLRWNPVVWSDFLKAQLNE